MKTHQISSKQLDFETIESIIANDVKLFLSKDAVAKIKKCRSYLDKRLKGGGAEPIYGINTGFGALHNKFITPSDMEQLQVNLLLSHACGTGEEAPREIVKLMLLLKIQGLSYGNSAVQIETVQRLIDFYNEDIVPVVYTQGSLGASGDLAPLAHLSLPLIGEGEVYIRDGQENYRKVSSSTVLKKYKWKPIRLQSKEGLALLNGTQFMAAYGVYILMHAMHLASMADFISVISLDAFDCHPEPFNAKVHDIRPHEGQIDVAENIRSILKGSQLIKRKKSYVQDPYSFRCIPQVHGASRDAINYAARTFLTEINSVTDNPTVFPDDDLIVSAGNFHGQPLALALDFLCIALSELGSISERRIFQLVSGQRGLPPFLTANPGLNSGFMIPQYTAASIVSQNKQLCTPASVDSIVTSNGQEDHVSMGANAATKALKVTDNLHTILAIELMTAAQALEFRRPQKSSPLVEQFIQSYRKIVSFLKDDRILYPDIATTRQFIGK